MLKWSEMFPHGRLIFYEGDDPEGFAKEMKEKFNFDPSQDNPTWNRRCGFCFDCPAEHLDAIYMGYPMGS